MSINALIYNAFRIRQRIIVHCTIFLDIAMPMPYLCTAT